VRLVALMATEIAFRKHHGSLFTFGLAERRTVNLLQRTNRVRATAIPDHRLNALDLALRKHCRR
jgi:hypothetical protein